MVTFGVRVGMDRTVLSDTVSASLPPIAGILLIVSAGGGFKQVLVDSGIGTLLADWARDANVSVLLLGWVLAVLIRLATGLGHHRHDHRVVADRHAGLGHADQ